MRNVLRVCAVLVGALLFGWGVWGASANVSPESQGWGDQVVFAAPWQGVEAKVTKVSPSKVMQVECGFGQVLVTDGDGRQFGWESCDAKSFEGRTLRVVPSDSPMMDDSNPDAPVVVSGANPAVGSYGDVWRLVLAPVVALLAGGVLLVAGSRRWLSRVDAWVPLPVALSGAAVMAMAVLADDGSGFVPMVLGSAVFAVAALGAVGGALWARRDEARWLAWGRVVASVAVATLVFMSVGDPYPQISFADDPTSPWVPQLVGADQLATFALALVTAVSLGLRLVQFWRTLGWRGAAALPVFLWLTLVPVTGFLYPIAFAVRLLVVWVLWSMRVKKVAAGVRVGPARPWVSPAYVSAGLAVLTFIAAVFGMA